VARIRSLKPTFEDAAEFRGLFFGEGHIDLMHPGHGSSLVPRLRLSLRDDDWQLTGAAAVRRAVLDLLGGSIPSKKRPELLLLCEALDLIPVPGRHIDPSSAARLHAIREDLKRLRRYMEVPA
jgi:hypothetical protein